MARPILDRKSASSFFESGRNPKTEITSSNVTSYSNREAKVAPDLGIRAMRNCLYGTRFLAALSAAAAAPSAAAAQPPYWQLDAASTSNPYDCGDSRGRQIRLEAQPRAEGEQPETNILCVAGA